MFYEHAIKNGLFKEVFNMQSMPGKFVVAGLGALVVACRKVERLIDELVEQGKIDGEDIKQSFDDIIKERKNNKKFDQDNMSGDADGNLEKNAGG